MGEAQLLSSLVLAVALAFVGGALAQRLGQPVILGYLLAGVIVSPFTPGPVADSRTISVLAEIGVALLMFSLGAEFSLGELRALGRVVTLGGPLQILLTMALGPLLAPLLGLSLATGAVLVAMRETFLDPRVPPDRRAGVFELLHSPLEDLALADSHDLAIINISLHEARDMERVVANARRSLREGGTFLVSEFPFPETVEACRDLPAQIMCGIQFFESHIGCQLQPTSRFVEFLSQAGFRDVRVIDVNPVHVVIHGTR